MAMLGSVRGAVLVFLLLLAGTGHADPAAGYFELGVDYLKKGFFDRAIAAFGESLIFEPDQGVPLAFAGIAASCEGRPTHLCARAIRIAYGRLPDGARLRLNLDKLLPNTRSRSLVEREFLRRAKRALTRAEQRDALTVAAFFQNHHRGRSRRTALEALHSHFPNDAWAIARRTEQDEAAEQKDKKPIDKPAERRAAAFGIDPSKPRR
jgi:hypothetical protein